MRTTAIPATPATPPVRAARGPLERNPRTTPRLRRQPSRRRGDGRRHHPGRAPAQHRFRRTCPRGQPNRVALPLSAERDHRPLPHPPSARAPRSTARTTNRGERARRWAERSHSRARVLPPTPHSPARSHLSRRAHPSRPRWPNPPTGCGTTRNHRLGHEVQSPTRTSSAQRDTDRMLCRPPRSGRRHHRIPARRRHLQLPVSTATSPPRRGEGAAAPAVKLA